MNSPEGQEVMLNTDFEQLLDKLLQLMTTILTKPSLIFEDKIIIENALEITVGTLLHKNELYTKFINFTSSSQIANAE